MGEVYVFAGYFTTSRKHPASASHLLFAALQPPVICFVGDCVIASRIAGGHTKWLRG